MSAGWGFGFRYQCNYNKISECAFRKRARLRNFVVYIFRFIFLVSTGKNTTSTTTNVNPLTPE